MFEFGHAGFHRGIGGYYCEGHGIDLPPMEPGSLGMMSQWDESRAPETLVFLRDDDVGEWTAALEHLVGLLLELGIPCHYQVVPRYLDADTAGKIRRLKGGDPELVHFNQHGLNHEQQLDGRSVYSEFAGGRPIEDQRADIAEGRDRLADALGEAFSSDVFTPPCHKYDHNTLRVLQEAGFEALSAGVRVDFASRLYYGLGRRLGRVEFLGKRVSYHGCSTPVSGIREVSASIDIHEGQDAAGNRIDKTLEDLRREFSVSRGRLRAVGLMMHHEACDTEEKRRVLRLFLQELLADPTVCFVRLDDLSIQEKG